MKGRVRLELLMVSEAAAEALRADMQSWIDGKADKWEVEGQDPVVVQKLAADWYLIADVAFDSRLSADQMADRITSRWDDPPFDTTVLAGSKVMIHDCEHDVDDGFCVVDVEAVK